eukprot:4602458-Alexandrium_andersonii.AAC.1
MSRAQANCGVRLEHPNTRTPITDHRSPITARSPINDHLDHPWLEPTKGTTEGTRQRSHCTPRAG